MTTAYAFELAAQHVYPGHPEAPGRFDLLKGKLDSFGAQALPTYEASRAEVGRVHTGELIEALQEASKHGSGIIDSAPTYVRPSSYTDALKAAGAALTCARAVLSGSAQNAFSIARPPGHHAEPDRAMGFCLFNNVAIAAREALSGEQALQRVAIVDYDAHHGNGTQAAFVAEPRVAYLSTHQWGIYPGTGWFTEAAEARRRIVNVPLPARAGDHVFQQVADKLISPFIRAFQPELILVSAGFDAHWNDPITSLGLSTAGFYMLSKLLVELAEEQCRGRIVFVLEGGYDALNLCNGAAAVFAALSGKPVDPKVDDRMPNGEPESALAQIETIRDWHGFEA